LAEPTEQADALDRIRERAVQARETQRQRVAQRLRNARQSDAARRGTHVAGDRVFDTETGLEGEVIHVARENVVVPTAK
jgi:hypothetical protein